MKCILGAAEYGVLRHGERLSKTNLQANQLQLLVDNNRLDENRRARVLHLIREKKRKQITGACCRWVPHSALLDLSDDVTIRTRVIVSGENQTINPPTNQSSNRSIDTTQDFTINTVSNVTTLHAPVRYPAILSVHHTKHLQRSPSQAKIQNTLFRQHATPFRYSFPCTSDDIHINY